MKPRHALLPSDVLDRARQLRRDATDVESFLWKLLRNRGFGGHKFRRQTPVGPFVADFYCHAARLVIELDGGGHNEPTQQQCDAQRDETMRKQGLRVLRFWDHDVLKRTEVVLQAIWDALGESPSP